MSELVLLGLVERAEVAPQAHAKGLSETNRRLKSRVLSIKTGEGPWQRGGWISAHPITCDNTIYQQLSEPGSIHVVNRHYHQSRRQCPNRTCGVLDRDLSDYRGRVFGCLTFRFSGGAAAPSAATGC